MSNPIRILLADDHALVRKGLRLVLEAHPDLRVVAEAADGAEAVRLSATGGIDVAVLDVTMPRLSGLGAAHELARRAPAVAVVMLSMHDNEQFLREARQAGARGYVLKAAADRELVEACRAAARGARFTHAGAVHRSTVAQGARVRVGDDDADPLSPREREIVQLTAEGHTTREIGELLHISEKTVERHRANIGDKLGLRSGIELTRYAIRTGLIEA